MDRINLGLIILAIVCFAVVTFPDDRPKVSPTVLFELGNAYNMAGRIAEAKACYIIVLEFEDRFGYKNLHLPKYQQMARVNLRNLEINKIFKASPLFKRGK